MRKLGIVWIAYTGIIGILCVIDSILSKFFDVNVNVIDRINLILIIIWIGASTIIFLGIIFQSLYLKSISKKMSNDELITYYYDMLNKPYKLFFLNNKRVINRNIGLLYLLKNDIDKSRELILHNKYYDIYSFYPAFIISAYDNNIDDMNKYYNKLLEITNKKFNPQKQSAIQIMNMIDSKIYDDALYSSTRYDIVKAICLRYKN